MYAGTYTCERWQIARESICVNAAVRKKNKNKKNNTQSYEAVSVYAQQYSRLTYLFYVHTNMIAHGIHEAAPQL